LDNGDWIGAIIVDFSEASDLVPHGRLLNKITNLRVDSKAVVWIRGFLLGRTVECQRWTATILEVIESSVIPLVSV
jgi:hypothetical protein